MQQNPNYILMTAVSPLMQTDDKHFMAVRLAVSGAKVIMEPHFYARETETDPNAKTYSQGQRRRLVGGAFGTLNVGSPAEWKSLVDFAGTLCGQTVPSHGGGPINEFYAPSSRREWVRLGADEAIQQERDACADLAREMSFKQADPTHGQDISHAIRTRQ